MMTSAIASAFPDFNLHTLGWKSFQDLALTILQHQLGQAVQRYSPVRDGGRDGAFQGEWHPTSGLSLSGATVVQCKFTNRRDVSLSASRFRDESQKARALWRRKRRKNYIVITNYRATAEFEERTREQFARFGCENFQVFGQEWIVAAIQQSAKLRSLVPRLYGLGDLSQIIDERWYEQTTKLLETERDSLRKFVPTVSYRRSVDALNENGFVLLLGDPAVGKTAIAATLALASGDAWKCRPMKIENAEQVREHWNPNEQQLFWIDDAFGTLHYEAGRAHAWNSVFPWLESVLRVGSKVIITSRTYIYERARRDLKQGAFPLLRESQVVIDVAELTQAEREQILYNHVRMGDQPRAWRRSFKAYFDIVAQHPEFRPEIARRLGTRAFTKNLVLSNANLSDFVAEPQQFLRETLEELAPEDRAALGAVFIRGGSLPSPIELTPSELDIIARLGGTQRDVVSGLAALRGSFVRLDAVGDQKWAFKHPTIGDAFATIVAADPELVDLYVSGAAMDKLLDEVTCGEVGLEGVEVVVPASRFGVVIARLHTFVTSRTGTWENIWARHRARDEFLATRCSREFLESYIEATPDFWDRVLTFGSYLSAGSTFGVVVALNHFGLLSSERRLIVVNRVKRLATETPDADFLTTEHIRRFFSADEIEEIMDEVRTKLIPNLEDVIRDWRSSYSRSEDPDSYFFSLSEALSAYLEYF